jgi:hypothetical protein
MMGDHRNSRREQGRGQALVEFAIALIPFLMLLMAIFDFGRGIYMYNGVSQAAREIARTASVHQGTTGYSTDAQATIDTQQALVPGLTVANPRCVNSIDADDGASTPGPCGPDTYLVVTAQATYTPVSLLGFLGTINLESKSRIQVPLSQNR